MSQWRIRLEGAADSLHALPRFLPSSCSLATRDDATYLDSPLFADSMKAEDLMAVGERLLDAANLVAMLHIPKWQAVRCDSASRLREDGTSLDIKLLSARIVSSASLTLSPTVVRADGSIAPPAQPPECNTEADIVIDCEPLRLALTYLRDPSWLNLYKAYELARAEMGGDQKMVALGWATGDLLSRFRHTSQSPSVLGAEARHAVEPTVPPSRPLGHSAAKRLVETLVMRWIGHKSGSESGT
jgi:hypothetical protein